ncbi:MAG: type IV pilus biogenesis protein PilP [Methyloprofundus sp.]|nr:type IV pilus biogenesis protein PilP [Methyloprofundus sp.]
MFVRKTGVATIIAFAFAGVISAQDLYLPEKISPELIEKLQSQKRLAQALYELEEVQKRRRELNAETTESMPSPHLSNPSLNLNWTGSNVSNRRLEPVVMSIEGRVDNLRAVLLVGQGTTQRVKNGDSANGWKIIKVEHDGVLASKDGQAKFLAFGDSNHIPQESVVNAHDQQPFSYQ